MRHETKRSYYKNASVRPENYFCPTKRIFNFIYLFMYFKGKSFAFENIDFLFFIWPNFKSSLLNEALIPSFPWCTGMCHNVNLSIQRNLRFHSLHGARAIKSVCTINDNLCRVTRHGTPVRHPKPVTYFVLWNSFVQTLPTAMGSKDLRAQLVLDMRWGSEKYENVSTACLHSGKNSCPFGPCLLDTYLRSSWCSGRSVPLCRCHWGCRSYLEQRTT